MTNIHESKKVYTEKMDWPLSTIRDKFAKGRIVPNPDYQREYIMDNNKASKLIESVLMGIPIPTVYLCEELDGRFSVIDGQQRLTSFVRFLDNKFELTGLQELSEFNGKKFKDLDEDNQSTIEEVAIHSIVLKKESQELKYEIFARLNQGSVSLKAQELRNCIFRGNLNDMLNNIAKHNKKLSTLFIKKNKRFQYQEDILRFFSLKNVNQYAGSLLKTMNIFMEKHQNDPTDEIESMKKEFNQLIDVVYTVLGNDAFCGYDRENGQMINKFSAPVYDSIMVSFSRFDDKHVLLTNADEIRKQVNEMKMNNAVYQDDTYAATGSKIKVERRIKMIYDLVWDIVSGTNPKNHKRAFSGDVKDLLWHEGYKCSYCGNTILNKDDAEVDHIFPFSKGGETLLENAQLLHSLCNKEKSAKVNEGKGIDWGDIEQEE